MPATETPQVGQAVVVVRGEYTNEPGVVESTTTRTAVVLLARLEVAVTVRHTSLDLY